MDPNTNPTSTPNPVPSGAPMPPAEGSVPAMGATPAAGAAAAAPAPTPAAAAGGMTTPPVNPIVTPTNPGAPGVVSTPTGGLAATDPIMMPEPAPKPDPIEEELKAPMKAAEPTPGSIGSAVSGPAAATTAEGTTMNNAPAGNPFMNDAKQTPSVAFNDPATQPDPAAGTTAPMAAGKKKTNKATLIALIAVVGIIIVVLAVILVMQLLPQNNQNNTPNSPVTIQDDDSNTTDNSNTNNNTNDDTNSSTNTSSLPAGSLSCTRNMTSAELVKYNDAESGAVNVSVEFDDDDLMTKISLVDTVVYSDEDAAQSEPVEETVHEAVVGDISEKSAAVYSLPVKTDGTIDFTKAGIRANYESLDFVCEVL